MASIINLNVGGVIYTTTHSTLTRYPDSMLGKMFTGDLQSAMDSNGNYFIDRDGKLFRYILLFLRSSQLLLPENFQEFDLLAAEAEFFQIIPLIEAVNTYGEGKREAQDIVSLNVSGTVYTVLKKHLEPQPRKYPAVQGSENFKAKLLGENIWEIVSNPNATKDKAGNYVLNGDPLLFRYILNFIQTGQLLLPLDFAEWFQLQIDLYRYGSDLSLTRIASSNFYEKIQGPGHVSTRTTLSNLHWKPQH